MKNKFATSVAVAGMLSFSNAGYALHGNAITITNGESELTIAYDPEDITAQSRSYIASPYGLMADIVGTFSGENSALDKIKGNIVVYLDFDDDGSVSFSTSQQNAEGEWSTTPPESLGRPADSEFIPGLICAKVLKTECSKEFSTRRASNKEVVFDRSSLKIDDKNPSIRIGSFPPSSASRLNVYSGKIDDRSGLPRFRSLRATGRAIRPTERFVGSISEAVDFMLQTDGKQESAPDIDRTLVPDNQEKQAPPFEKEGLLPSGRKIADGYDPRLTFIALHCTGPGVMSQASILKYKSRNRKNKGHGYIMPDGEYITVQSIKRPVNDVYATKTETCLRSQAMGRMFAIELNYDCHWRPSHTSNPPDAMLEKLADVVVWTHQNIGPLNIVSHTYVDMGLRDGHTDPQGNPGFPWASLYAKIAAKGGDLASVNKVDPDWAKRWPISRTDRAHAYEPAINRPIPSGRDECRRYAAN